MWRSRVGVFGFPVPGQMMSLTTVRRVPVGSKRVPGTTSKVVGGHESRNLDARQRPNTKITATLVLEGGLNR